MDVPENKNTQLARAICGFYNIKRRLCKKYVARPLMCKMYPFWFGVEEGEIIVSTSLCCPATNSKNRIENSVLLELFEDKRVGKMVTLSNDCYERAVLLPGIWYNAQRIWKTIVTEVQGFFTNVTKFPVLERVRQIIVQIVADSLKVSAPELHIYPVPRLFKHQEGPYIATRFESCHLGLVQVRGSKTMITLFDENLKRLKRIRMKTPTEFLNLEIDKSAKRLLDDYISFLCRRPFLSLAATLATTISPQPVPSYLSNILSGSFLPMEVGATLIALRDNLKAIDRETMREIISFSEEAIVSSFKRPDIAFQGP